MNFNRLNNIVGWIVCLIACTVYVLTMEATGSLWDCGEFISSAFKLQVPHPPGAPMFILLGRFFIVLFGDNPQTAGSGRELHERHRQRLHHTVPVLDHHPLRTQNGAKGS